MEFPTTMQLSTCLTQGGLSLLISFSSTPWQLDDLVFTWGGVFRNDLTWKTVGVGSGGSSSLFGFLDWNVEFP